MSNTDAEEQREDRIMTERRAAGQVIRRHAARVAHHLADAPVSRAARRAEKLAVRLLARRCGIRVLRVPKRALARGRYLAWLPVTEAAVILLNESVELGAPLDLSRFDYPQFFKITGLTPELADVVLGLVAEELGLLGPQEPAVSD